MQDSLSEAVQTALKFYKENNLEVPKNVVEYIANFPKGMSRQMLKSRYNIKTSEFVKLLNPLYEKPLDASSRALKECERLKYKLLTDTALLKNKESKVDVECLDCGYIHNTSISSLFGSTLGCLKCKAGNLPWNKREKELDDLLIENFNSVRISDIPNNESGYLTVLHICGTEYTSQLLGFINPNTKNRGTCPNCRDTDRRVTVEGITFGSQFEYECFKFIKHLKPEMHVPYSKYLNTSRRWSCDFKIDNIWIEVSNFKQDFKNYSQNIKDKESLVNSSEEYNFFFIQSLKEMEELANLI